MCTRLAFLLFSLFNRILWRYKCILCQRTTAIQLLNADEIVLCYYYYMHIHLIVTALFSIGMFYILHNLRTIWIFGWGRTHGFVLFFFVIDPRGIHSEDKNVIEKTVVSYEFITYHIADMHNLTRSYDILCIIRASVLNIIRFRRPVVWLLIRRNIDLLRFNKHRAPTYRYIHVYKMAFDVTDGFYNSWEANICVQVGFFFFKN